VGTELRLRIQLKNQFVISRLLVQDVLTVNLSYARFRPRGMLVIARRSYLSVFCTQIFHFEVALLSPNTRTESALSLSLS